MRDATRYVEAINEESIQHKRWREKTAIVRRAKAKNSHCKSNIEKSKILLLDEATSALNAESEAIFQDAPDKVMTRRTTVVLAHRLSTTKGANIIAVVKNDEIAEIGSHETPMNGEMKQRKSKSRENGDDSSVADHANGNEELQQRDEDTKKREKKKKKQQQLRKEDQDEEEKFEKKEKKKKLMKEEEENDDDEGNRTIKTKEKKKPKKGEGGAGEVEAVKRWMATVSIAVAGSIVDNAQSFELATRLAGQIARAATIFRVDEVIVFDNKVSSADDSGVAESEDAGDSESGAPFLGMLPPLDAPHHLRRHEWAPYREAAMTLEIVLKIVHDWSYQQREICGDIDTGPGQRLQEYLKPLDLDYPIVRHARVTLKGKPSNSTGTFVDVGLNKNVIVEGVLEPGKRVTVAMGTNRQLETDYLRKVVPSSKPREELGQYWGYKVRYASNISQIFSGCPHEGGYDYTIGTSEHGHIISSSELAIPTFRHLLIAFGGLGGLEENIEEDCDLKGKDVQKVFDAYLNICPHQGSRTIRTEEAIFIALQYFQEPIERSTHRFKPTVLKTKGIGYSHQGHLQVAPSVK
ncbi:hypothetical protein ACLOJK_026019 [Asimina triloba]